MTTDGSHRDISFIGITAIAAGLYLSSFYSYLLFHTLVELATISIGFTLFIIAWNTHRFLKNDILSVLGIGYAFIALIDLFHTIAYKGMNIIPGATANLPTQLWIASRFLQASTLCMVPLLGERRVDRRVIAGVFVAAASILMVLIVSGHFPDCFIEGQGLTRFKIASEYVISGFLIFSVSLFYKKRRYLGRSIFILLTASIACTVLSGLAFTAYLSVYGFANLFGHLAKFAAFYLLYRALLVTGLKEPFDLIFRDLKLTEAALQQERDSLEERVRERSTELMANKKRYQALIEKVKTAIVLHDHQGHIVECNLLASELLGLSRDQLLGKTLIDPGWSFLRDDGTVMPVAEYPASRVLADGQPLQDFMVGIRRPGFGYIVWVLVNAEPERDDAGTLTHVIVSFVDVTERRNGELALHRLNRELRAMGSCNQALVRADEEQGLIREVCHIICDTAGYRMAWVGYAEAGTLRTAAWAATGEDAFDDDIAATPSVEAALRTGVPQWLQDFAAEPDAWRGRMLLREFRSCISLPLKDLEAHTFGILTIYAADPEAFIPQERRLLEELASDLAFGIVTLRTRIERRRTAEALRTSEQMLREAQRIGHFGYWNRDFHAGLITLSDEIYRIFDIPVQEESMDLDEWQTRWLELIHPEDRERVSEAYSSALQQGKSYDVEYRIIRPGGEQRVVHSYAKAIPDDDTGHTRRMIGTMQDITDAKQTVEQLNQLNEELELHVQQRTAELKESQQALMNIVEDLNQKTGELENANARLLELDRLKSMFIASMSHELRTPLNSIIGFSSIIRDGWIGAINAEQKENLDIIQRAGKHLLNLINDVIDVSKIEAGKIDIRLEEFDLYDLLTEAAQYVERDIREKGLTLTLDIRHRQLRTDRRRLLQCVINLVSNAVKFTERGEIGIYCSVAEPDGATGGRVTIRVRDTGIGISEKDLPTIFGPFVRLESPLKVIVPGTGLGLYLTRKLVAGILGGDIECSSVLGQGSCFTLSIPEKAGETVSEGRET